MSRLRLSFFGLFLLLTCSGALVPIVGWSNSDAFSSMQESEFRSANDFLYSASMDKIQMIIIFKAPELSFDQLAKYGGLYGSQVSSLFALQNELEMAKSSVWAGAGGRVTSDLVETLSFLLNTKPYVISGYQELKEVHKLMVVELPAGKGEDGLVKQDKVIGDLMGSVGDLPGSPTYAAVFTSDGTHTSTNSKHSSSSSSSSSSPVRLVKRDANPGSYDLGASDDTEDDGTECAKVSDGSGDVCILLCIQPLINVSLDESLKNVTSNKVVFNESASLTSLEFVGGDCNTGNGDCDGHGDWCILFDAYGENEAETRTQFMFVFLNGYCTGFSNTSTTRKIACGFYTMEVYIDGEKYQRHREEQFVYSNLTIPKNSAYGCGDNGRNTYYSVPDNFSDTRSKKDVYEYENISVYHFNTIQVQAFGGFQVDSYTKESVFGSTYNCQGYVSIESLMGIVSIIILIIILYCSVVFMFSINALDRFDDPRGPTITIENLH